MKKLFSLFAAVLFAGSMMAEQATIAKGTTNSYDDNTINGKATVKMGKSGAGGNMTITVGAGATSLSFYSAAWNHEGASVTITAPEGVTIAPDSYTVVATSELAGSSKSFTVANEENYKFTFALTGVTAETTFTLTSVKRCFVWDATYATGDTPADPVVEYYLVGSMNNWTPATGYKFAANGANAGEYMLKTTFAANDQFKVRKVIDGEADAWYPDGTDNNYVINDAGRYNVYFRPDGQGGEGWHQGCIYAARILPKTCAEVYSMAKDDEVLLNDLTVTYVNGKNVYVKDASGAMLLYLPDVVEWAAGDVLSGVEGTVDIYKNLYEVKPSAAQVAAVTATAGTAPEPIEFTAAPEATDMNKYIVMNNVSVSAASFPDNKNMDVTIGDQTIVLRNNFNANIAFDTEKTYDITGVVAVYNDNVQVYFISAEEYVEPVVPADRRINAYGLNVVANGDDYVFSYYANIAGNEANLLFYKDGVLKGRVAVEDPVQGINDVTLAKSEIPEGTGLTWAVELKANPVTAFNKVFESTKSYNRLHATIDNSPESDYFQRIYMTNNGTVGKGIFMYDPDYTEINSEVLTAGLAWGSPARLDVDAYGKVWIMDWADGDAAGVWVLDPANTTSVEQFYDFATKTDKGQYKNAAGVELGEGGSAVGVFGKGADMWVYTTGEEGGSSLKANGLNLYHVGQTDESVLYKWGQAPTVIANIANNANGTFSLGTTSHGVFMGQNRSAGQNNSTAYAAMFYDNEGEQRWNSDTENHPEINGCNAAGLGVSWDEKRLAMVDGSSHILVYDLTWTGDVPTVTYNAQFDVPAPFAASVDFDYAGNIIATIGSTGYKPAQMGGKLYVYGVPTDKNEIIVPAKKALVVEGTDPNPTTAIDNIYVLDVQKVIRNGQVLIIKDGKTYNMMGQIVE